MINKFIIIGEARSGTTSLNGILNNTLSNPETKKTQPVLGEPFTLVFKKSDDPDPCVANSRPLYNYVHGENGFFSRLPERTIDYINPKRSAAFKIESHTETPQYVFNDIIDLSFSENFGIKELIRSKDYCEKFLKATSRYNYKYIHLVRQNFLATAISFWLSTQHGVWNIPANWSRTKELRESRINKIKNFPIEPLDIKVLEDHVRRLTKREKILEEKKNKNWMTVYFKNLYSQDCDLRYDQFSKISDFLNIDFCLRTSTKIVDSHDFVDKFLDKGKRTTQDYVYDKIPNLKEILNHFNYTKEQLIERV